LATAGKPLDNKDEDKKLPPSRQERQGKTKKLARTLSLGVKSMQPPLSLIFPWRSWRLGGENG
jgi:hypothetical protein